MIIKSVECDGVLNDDVEYLYKGKSYCDYKGKSYCDDCYRTVKKAEAVQQHKGT
jgi:hypothetical protein